MDAALPPGQYVPFPAFADWDGDVDLTAVDLYADLLQQARVIATEEAMSAAVQVATRYAAVDTGAIEGLYATTRGFTRTIAEQTATWEAALAQHGDDVAGSIADALNGYEMVLDLVTGRAPLTEAWLRQLHEVICASQETYAVFTAVGQQRQPLPKGQYKTMPNNPTSADTGRVHHYAPVDDTPAEMARLVAELCSSSFEAAHPVRQAAYAHYAFVCVHPFADGNGRVARALASVFLYRSPGVPLVVFADQKEPYLDALEAADARRPQHFVSFVAERTMDTIELVRSSLGAAASVPADVSLAALRRYLSARGVDQRELEATNARILGLVTDRLTAHVGELDLPGDIGFVTGGASARFDAPRGYRRIGSGQVDYRFFSRSLPEAAQYGALAVWTAGQAAGGPDFLGTDLQHNRTLAVFLRDVIPVESHVLSVKIDNWIRAVVADDLAALSESVHEQLARSGYLTEG
ncbi:MAG: Fic family protein [Geodermatophilaceae bacterium]|nr:Fic family protein [Geodermatophilaceae bacterium]